MKQLINYIDALFLWTIRQIDNIASGIIASIIIITFSEVIGIGQLSFRKYKIKRMWRLRGPAKIDIVSGSVNASDPFIQSPTSWPDANAASILIQGCKDLYPNANISHFFEFDPDGLTGNIISVGGPINNPATASLMEYLKNIVLFNKFMENEKEEHFSLTVDGKIFIPQIKNGAIIKDFGAIIRMRNPINSKSKDSILVVGCETFGVLAASLVLIRDEVAIDAQNALNKNFPLLSKNVDYIAVFSCRPLRFSVGDIRLEYFLPIEYLLPRIAPPPT